MAIQTYAELQAAAASWLARSDLTARIPEFIALAEAKINRVLRTQDMVTKNATFSITGEYVAVPTGFQMVKTFHLNTSPKRVLEFMPDDQITKLFGAATGKPRYYCVQGGNFRFGPTPDATYSSTLVYVGSLVGLATTSPNWLLTSHPDVYLYGTLLEAEGFLADDPRVPLWKQAFDMAVNEVNAQANANRWGGNSMAVRVG